MKCATCHRIVTVLAWMFLVAAVTARAQAAKVEDLSNDFYQAIRANNMPQLRALVAKGADVNTKGPGDVTPLMDAAVSGSLDAMRFLIDKAADVNAKDSGGRTALIRSATDLAKIRLLLDH